MQLSPTILIHMTAAIGALVTGPVALWARKGAKQRPMLHRAFGYAWVTLMIVAAVSALFIRDTRLPNVLGYTPIHLLVPFTLFSLVGAFRALARRDIARHRWIMQRLYIGACVVAGAFTLLPGRYLGDLLGTRQLFAIFGQTPPWVWGLLAALLVLGYAQSRDRKASLVRIAITPLAMTAFSLLGTLSAFKHSAMLPAVLTTWALLAAITFAAVAAGRAAGSYDAATRTLSLPGSWTPLALILGIFSMKYASNVLMAMHPHLVNDSTFALGLAAVGGAFSGVFTGRAARLVKLTLRPVPPTAALRPEGA